MSVKRAEKPIGCPEIQATENRSKRWVIRLVKAYPLAVMPPKTCLSRGFRYRSFLFQQSPDATSCTPAPAPRNKSNGIVDRIGEIHGCWTSGIGCIGCLGFFY